MIAVETQATGMQCVKDLSCDVFAAAGLSGPPDGALHRPEGQTILSYPHQVHELWTSGCNGKNLHTTDCVRRNAQPEKFERTTGDVLRAAGFMCHPAVVSAGVGRQGYGENRQSDAG